MWLNISNFFTLIRIFISPFIFITIIRGQVLASLILFFVAAITDFLDGYTARRFNLQTALGAHLDPLADKIFLIISFFALFVRGFIPLWFLIFMIVRELTILLGYIFIKVTNKKVTIIPTIWGKLNTFFAIVLIFLNLTFLYYGLFPTGIQDVFLFGVSFLAFFSLMHYVKIGIKLWKSSSN